MGLGKPLIKKKNLNENFLQIGLDHQHFTLTKIMVLSFVKNKMFYGTAWIVLKCMDKKKKKLDVTARDTV